MKVRINLHGLFTVASASLTEKKETIEEPSENMETEEKVDKVREGEHHFLSHPEKNQHILEERTTVRGGKESMENAETRVL